MKTNSSLSGYGQLQLKVQPRIKSQVNRWRSSTRELNEDVATLTWLGLSGRQARVYLALLKTGPAKAKTIAELSFVNRQDIYRIIESLQAIGLVQRQITAPTMFTATSIEETLENLLKQKTRALRKMRTKAKCIVKKFNQNSNSIALQTEKPALA
jgi:sugar-specific transcriptional regulator TrmB